MSQPLLVITSGDPASISPEILIKQIKEDNFWKKIPTIIVGHKSIFTDIYKFHNFVEIKSPSEAKAGQISILNIGTDRTKINIGTPSKVSGKISYESIVKAVEILKTWNGSLVTLPVSKKAINLAGIKFIGHTELLCRLTNTKQTEMLIIGKEHRILILTRHVPLSRVSRNLTTKRIIDAIVLAKKSLESDFRIKKPKILLCGLNPHCGDNGLIGKDEESKIKPAISYLRGIDIDVDGPYPYEKCFELMRNKKADLIVSMYHDQAIIPMKILYGFELVNLTIGLPFIRTSPVHGTAFDIAGKGVANHTGLKKAIEVTIDLNEKRMYG